MISCLIAIQVWALTSFQTVAIPAENLFEAQLLAAIEAGRMTARHPSSRESRFGFECDRQGWVAVDLDRSDLFADSRGERLRVR